MKAEYREWIRHNVPACPRGLCDVMTQTMVDEFPMCEPHDICEADARSGRRTLMNVALLGWATCGAAISLVADILFKRQSFWGGCGLYMLASYPALKAFQVGSFGQTIFLWELLFVLLGAIVGRFYFGESVTVKHLIGAIFACISLWLLLSAQDGGRP